MFRGPFRVSILELSLKSGIFNLHQKLFIIRGTKNVVDFAKHSFQSIFGLESILFPSQILSTQNWVFKGVAQTIL